MNISGNYATSTKEIEIVKELLNDANIVFTDVIKDVNANDSDVIVIFEERQMRISVEIKEEAFYRFSRYHDLGIDYISVFHFINRNDINKWKGAPKSNNRLEEFENEIVVVKPGKIDYSEADAWLFFCRDESGNVYYNSWFSGNDMTSTSFKNYLRRNCSFAINNKPEWQGSYGDNHQSAVFFINSNDNYLLGIQKTIYEIFRER